MTIDEFRFVLDLTVQFEENGVLKFDKRSIWISIVGFTGKD